MKIEGATRLLENATEISLAEVAAHVSPFDLPAMLKELPSERKVAVVVAHFQARLPNADGLRAIAGALTADERGQILLFAGAARPSLEAAGFSPAYEPVFPTSTPEDRARLLSDAKVELPPLLAAFIARRDFVPRIAAVRAGRCGLTASEKSEVIDQLRELDMSQLRLLRRMLVEKPPHPELKKMSFHPALSGPPTLEAVYAILCGAPLGLVPEANAEMVGRAERFADTMMMLEPAGVRQSWMDYLLSSNIALVFAELYGRVAIDILSKIDLAALEIGAGLDWGRQHALVAAFEKAKPREIEVWIQKNGARAFRKALKELDRVSWYGKHVETGLLVGELGFEAAAKLGSLLAESSVRHGLRALCVVHKKSSSELVRSLLRKTEAEIRAYAARGAAKIPAFGASNAPLYAGGDWPPPFVPRSEVIARAEAKLLVGTGIDPQVFAADRSKLSSRQLSEVAERMRRAIDAREPRRLVQLDRELEGRRFVSYRYYDELYERGIVNPEHRYSVETFQSWRSAARLVAERAEQSKRRPLKRGELTALLQEVHAIVGQGMIDVGETHMAEGDLGRIRSRKEDRVALGDGFHRVDANTAKALAQNPYLQAFLPFEEMKPDDEGQYSRFISFAAARDVPRLIVELEDFVLQNEALLTPEQLAAEVHFRLVSIHPFMDGNGRTAKLLADFLLARAGIRPPVWREAEVMKHQARWPEVVREGVEYDLATVERYFRRMIEAPAA